STRLLLSFFFFNDTATTEIYTLSLHDALPILGRLVIIRRHGCCKRTRRPGRSEEHTSELQSHHDLVCRLLLEKKKKIHRNHKTNLICTTMSAVAYEITRS